MIGFLDKDGDKDKNNKLVYFPIDGEKLLEKHEIIWTKMEDLKKYWIECFTSLW